MSLPTSRRHFLKTTSATGALMGLGDLSFLSQLPGVSRADAQLPSRFVQFRPEIEPLVRVLEDTQRDRLLEEVAKRVKQGLNYRELLAALLLAGVRNIQPRPVGFEFHAVLVVNSAHLASIDGAAADVVVGSLARAADAQDVFEIFCRFGARDFRDLGHKAIYVANGWRTLQHIGWQHAEPVLRSLAYALLFHEGDNPAKRDAEPDRPWRRNQELAARIRNGWQQGKPGLEATTEMLETLRDGSTAETCDKAVAQLNRGVGPQSIWDALFLGSGELLMRRPGIVSLHAVTTINALHFAYQTSSNDETRRLLLLQSAAFLPLFRGDLAGRKGVRIDLFEALPTKSSDALAIEEIFADVSGLSAGVGR